VIEPFLHSMLDVEHPPIVVIAENASPDADRTGAIAEKLGATFLRLDENLGYGGAINAAVASLATGSEYILISNPDLIATPDLVPTLESWLDAHPRVGAVGPRLLNEDGSIYPSARALPSLRTGIGHAVFANVWPTNPWTRRYRFEGQYSDEPRSTEWLSGACLMVRRAAFEEVGGFDSGYFMYFEDVDLGQRLGVAGWTSQYVPTVSATHLGARSTITASDRMLEAHHRSAARYLNKRYPGVLLAPLRLVLRAGLSIRLRLLRRA
jgi:N-acetylglucosaminyl-diphospho-decaprenol L-rhamnosyltransferase